MDSDFHRHSIEVVTVDTGIKQGNVPHIAHELTTLLASCYVLTLKTQSVHWDLCGPQFYSLHQLTETHYESLFEAVDTIAERIRALGYLPPKSFTQIVKHSQIPEFEVAFSTQEMLGCLLADHEMMARLCHQICQTADEGDDIVTADMVTECAAFHEKAAWMLRATLS